VLILGSDGHGGPSGAVLVADVGYWVNLARHAQVLVRQSLIAAVALPVLLLVQIPRFFQTREPKLPEVGRLTPSHIEGDPRRIAHQASACAATGKAPAGAGDSSVSGVGAA